MKKLTTFYLMLLLCLFTQGCFIGTHSFNNGKLLNPGQRQITTGVGWKYSARYLRQYKEIGSSDSIRSYFDSTRFGWCDLAIDYRIGVLRKYPFGKGLETGFHIETAFRGDQSVSYGKKGTTPEFYSSPLLEIETRFGFNDINVNKGIYHHNANIGWAIGQWVDNGWFLGYAAGVEFDKMIVFSSFRYLITASDKMNDGTDIFDDYFKTHQRAHSFRLSCGSSLKLPVNETICPEYITPEFSLIFPKFSRVQPVGFSFSIGISWMPGF